MKQGTVIAQLSYQYSNEFLNLKKYSTQTEPAIKFKRNQSNCKNINEYYFEMFTFPGQFLSTHHTALNYDGKRPCSFPEVRKMFAMLSTQHLPK